MTPDGRMGLSLHQLYGPPYPVAEWIDGELEYDAIGVVTPDRRYRRLVEDPRLSRVDDFELSADGHELYAVTNRLHLSAPANAGVGAGEPPFYLFRLRPLAPGR